MRRFTEISILILLTIVFLWIYQDDSEYHELNTIQGPISVPEVDMKTEYGLLLDTLNIVKDEIGKNEFLADILLRYNVDYPVIETLVRKSKSVFNVRKIRKGSSYSIIQSNDSIKKTLFFVYEKNPTDYIVFDLRDSVSVRQGVKKVDTRINTVSAAIESSLWNAMVAQSADPNLANDLSEIFAWTVDFFGVQKGDSFKAIYEELYVGDERIGLGKVLASSFHHVGNDYNAFYFVQDSVGDYYDENAGSLRRTFLKAPLRFRRISSGFSYNRFHPVLKIYRPHTGVDYAADAGTPVHAVGDGVVIRKGWSKQGGRIVKIKHNGTYTTAYMHLSGWGKGIKKGAKVVQGQVIGFVGSSGLATGPHLDFRFYRNGKPINPLKVKSPSAKPVESAYLEGFKRVMM
jgi:murein DD-endopeptidase MepM/ murein hydrolase activator NlpD